MTYKAKGLLFASYSKHVLTRQTVVNLVIITDYINFQIDPLKPVLIPGDPEKLHMKAVDEVGGVRYVPNQINACQKLAERLGVAPMKPLA